MKITVDERGIMKKKVFMFIALILILILSLIITVIIQFTGISKDEIINLFTMLVVLFAGYLGASLK